MAEWSKALVLGTSHFDGVGSNPTAASNFLFTLYSLVAFLQVSVVASIIFTAFF